MVMLNLAVAVAMAALTSPATVTKPAVFMLTSAEKASGFETLAECEQALGDPDQRTGLRGSRFNREAGNTSRCEVVEGEPLIVVYPRGHEAPRSNR